MAGQRIQTTPITVPKVDQQIITEVNLVQSRGSSPTYFPAEIILTDGVGLDSPELAGLGVRATGSGVPHSGKNHCYLPTDITAIREIAALSFVQKISSWRPGPTRTN